MACADCNYVDLVLFFFSLKKSKFYQTLLPQIQEGTVKQTVWETKGQHTVWVLYHTSRSGCTDLDSCHEVDVSADITESVKNRTNTSIAWFKTKHI